MAKYNRRIDHDGPQRVAYEKNRKYILKTQTVCGICGRPVDFSRKFPDPLAPVVDHIVPISLGGHPSARDNLQLAHNICNRQKSDKMQRDARKNGTPDIIPNNILPQHCDWVNYRSTDNTY